MEGRAVSRGENTRPDESTSTSKLFCDPASHEPLAFHLHSALPSKLKAELTHLIKATPQYATYVSSRPEGERGTVVPYSFALSSITAREVLRPVDFQAERLNSHEGVDTPWAPLALTRGLRRKDTGEGRGSGNGSTGDQASVEDDGWGGLEPVAVHLHSTIGRDERRRLAADIAKAGGDPRSSAGDARVILVDQDHAEFFRLRKQYEHSLRTYVEPVTWVARCIAKGRYFHDPIEKTPMSGRKPGADRNDFTTEDDNNLARFIAKRIPDKSDGGRTGNNLYKDLCERTDIYPWAAGHTWQSWRNRYRKKQEYFDPIIDKYVTSRQDNGDGKGEFQYTRGKKRSVPGVPSSRSPSVLSNDEAVEEDAVSSRSKRLRPLNASALTIDRDTPGNKTKQRKPAYTSPGSSLRQQDAGSSQNRVRPSAANVQSGVARKTGGTPRSTGGSGMDRSSSRQDQIEGVRVGRQPQQDNSASMTSRASPPPTEATTLAPGVDTDLLMSNSVSGDTRPVVLGVLGYDSDHEFHAKAEDLGLSDYLGSGFTSTW